ncbi:hypothetical protein [Streptomyces sp. S.PNR 29]|uniref:hypothetical protein n=1 Tax=Streptomyces sp. S.PNR 29 TaxID=2973805 RepID=UPI0025AF735D|nr:hypothetical protein [Streptomyces sp. S.PNR 29]MDN0200100.1 hypothetical protein [Streptomyces sp. S.PNR 29]
MYWRSAGEDYHRPQDLREALRERVDRLRKDTGRLFDHHLADTPGTKLGGHPGWSQEPAWPDCASCGRRPHIRGRSCPDRPIGHWFDCS